VRSVVIVAAILAGVSAGYCEYSAGNSIDDSNSNVEENSIKEIIKQEIPYASDEQLNKIEKKLFPIEVKVSSGEIEPQNYNGEALVVQYPDGPDGIEEECNQEFLKQARRVIEIAKSGTNIPYVAIELPRDAGALQTNSVLALFRNLLSESQVDIPIVLRWFDHYSAHEEHATQTSDGFQKSSTSVTIEPNNYERVYYNEQYSSNNGDVKNYSSETTRMQSYENQPQPAEEFYSYNN
jgi:hypothetical protein